MRHKIITLIYCACAMLLVSCENFLDEKSDKKLAVPNKLKDFQALLDDYPNVGSGANEGEISADDYYLQNSDVNALIKSDKGMYLWDGDIPHIDRLSSGWTNGFREVYYSNLVLDGLEGYKPDDHEKSEFDNIKGQAFFIRGVAYFNMALVWSPAYNIGMATNKWGLPLRTSSDFNIPVTRAELGRTFEFIKENLEQAAMLLPIHSQSKYRPSRAAAFAYLARLSLYIGDFDTALGYAEDCLAIYDKLIDYNTLDIKKNYPMPAVAANDEVIYYRAFTPQGKFSATGMRIVESIYDSYEDNDLRKTMFFKENVGYRTFRGNYSGSSSLFCGAAVDEMYLIRSECYARDNQLGNALSVLNKLLESRWKKVNGESLYEPIEPRSKDEVVQLVLSERRKQLLVRTLRWYDVKRLNALGANISLTRNFNGKTYVLPPNDPRYALPIPINVIEISKIEQNPN
ncbi:MAG: RagB/SusD family nutrient uptake outer membrane protein [Sphingobacterium sp.]|jgi:tetratricopeptide (TPR) repeat protein|nr:RagB/SusD family nutrient uptake outer membrane protein [Sphingobacterium sp.]